MTPNDFTFTVSTDSSPVQVYEAINDVGAWWAENFTGESHQVGGEFETRFGDLHYSKQQVTELVPGKRVAWLVTDSSLSFLEHKTEWTGTRIYFDITLKDGKTELKFTHEGLVPEAECFDACSNAWPLYFHNSLLCLLSKGKGQPGFPPEQPCE